MQHLQALRLRCGRPTPHHVMEDSEGLGGLVGAAEGRDHVGAGRGRGLASLLPQLPAPSMHHQCCGWRRALHCLSQASALLCA